MGRITYFLTDMLLLAIEIYVWLIIIRVIISYFRPRTYHPVIRFIYEVTEPLLSLCRRFLPGPTYGLDFSPLLAIIFLEILRWVVVSFVTRVLL